MKFKESEIAHTFLDGLDIVVEIGAAAHNPFNIKCKQYINVDFSDDEIFHKAQKDMCGEIAKVDKFAPADKLPFADSSIDAVLTSHVLEHCFDPIATLREWIRVTRSGGYLFMIIPHKERTFDHAKPITPILELINRNFGALKFTDYGIEKDDHRHWNIWDTHNFLKVVDYMGLKVVATQDSDDKVGNGFCVVIEV